MSEPRVSSGVSVAAVVIVLLIVFGGLVAWSSSVSDEDTRAQSLCAAYDELLDAGAALRAADPETSTAGEATDLVDDYLTEVRRVQVAADGRYGSQLDALDEAVSDVQRTLSSVQEDADYSTWAPLVSDDVETALDAAAEVTSVIGPSCERPDL